MRPHARETVLLEYVNRRSARHCFLEYLRSIFVLQGWISSSVDQELGHLLMIVVDSVLDVRPISQLKNDTQVYRKILRVMLSSHYSQQRRKVTHDQP